MTKKEGFVIYKDYYQFIKTLSQAQKAELMDAIFEYQISGKIIETSPLVQGIFQVIKIEFDADNNFEEVTNE